MNVCTPAPRTPDAHCTTPSLPVTFLSWETGLNPSPFGRREQGEVLENLALLLEVYVT
jgi:hypothetical protein